MKIVLDTNVLLVSLPRHSPFFPIYDAFLNGQFTLCLTNEIVLEYEEQMGFRYNVETTELKMEELLRMRNVVKINAYYHWRLIAQDSDDDKFADCAIAANVDYLVTNDTHFNLLRTLPFPRVKIITAQAYLEIVKRLPEVNF